MRSRKLQIFYSADKMSDDFETAVRRAQELRQKSVQDVLQAAVEFCVSVIRVEENKKHAESVKRKGARRRRTWVRSWVGRRHSLGGEVLLRELADEDGKTYRNALRMSSHLFDELLQSIASLIQRQDTRMRTALPARLKLEVTLRYLATGDSFASLSLFFRLPVSTISTFLPDVLNAIHNCLAEYIKVRLAIM
jgi:hypothetical protein